jgi:hypothetical protein
LPAGEAVGDGGAAGDAGVVAFEIIEVTLGADDRIADGWLIAD